MTEWLARTNIILVVLDLRFCAQAFSNCGEQGLLPDVVLGLLTAVASLIVEATGSRHTGFSSCDTWVQL